MTVHGIPYQYTVPRNIFLRKYVGLDGYEREKWFRTDPSTDASFRYAKLVERTLRRNEANKHPLRIRRFAFQVWFNAFGPTAEPGYLFKYKLLVLNRMMYLVNKYLICQNKSIKSWRSDSWKLMVYFLGLAREYANQNFKRVELLVE
jgi:hypothetical protein